MKSIKVTKDNIVAMFDVKIDKDVAVASPECCDAVEELKKIKRQIKLLQESHDLLRDSIAKEMGEKERLMGVDGTIIVTYKWQNGRTDIDKDLLLEFYPEAYNDCLKTGKKQRHMVPK